jgi:hypothetical protein
VIVLSKRQKQEARDAYLADVSLSVEALATRYGVSRTQMLRTLAGITRKAGGVERSRLTTEQMRALADAGLTLEQIGRQAGITKSGVSRRLARAQEQERIA